MWQGAYGMLLTQLLAWLLSNFPRKNYQACCLWGPGASSGTHFQHSCRRSGAERKVGDAVAELCSAGTRGIWLPGQGECLCERGLARGPGMPGRQNRGWHWLLQPQSQLLASPDDQRRLRLAPPGGAPELCTQGGDAIPGPLTPQARLTGLGEPSPHGLP